MSILKRFKSNFVIPFPDFPKILTVPDLRFYPGSLFLTFDYLLYLRTLEI